MKKLLPVGNEWISLPDIDEDTGGIFSITFLTMQYKGMVALRGTDCEPFLKPMLRRADGTAIPLQNPVWKRAHHWLPALCAEAGGFAFSMTILPPVHERGFAIRMTASSTIDTSLIWGMSGVCAGAWHCVNEEKSVEGSMHLYKSAWNDGVVLDFRAGFPVFAFAPMTVLPCHTDFSQELSAVRFQSYREDRFLAGEEKSFVFFFGLGFEEVAAATSAKQMLRRGWDWEYRETARWLDARAKCFSSPQLTELYNTNLFFCLFFATGRTLDTEELVCTTSRSSRYYVSAAYWDRDTLLWAFPAIVSADRVLAKELLLYVFTRQRKNFGIHSRYIDGTVLEPGFELDELVSPVLALETYVRATEELDFMQEPCIRAGLDEILRKLEQVYQPKLGLYETFLQPTDDEIVHPFLTYDNVLVWHAFQALCHMLPGQYAALSGSAKQLETAIWTHCVRKSADGTAYFAWSVDIDGAHDVYDEPPGSLQLLPYYGFCDMANEVWKNTVAMIRSPGYRYSFAGDRISEIGCPHAPYPWVLSLCNSLLSGHKAQAFQELEHLPMDNGIACESVDPNTGVCTTGAAFATCAGFLCHSILTAYEEEAVCETI